MTMSSIIALILAIAGMLLMIVSLFGLIIYPDFFSKLHVQGVGDTLGALLLILAMMVYAGFSLFTAKLFLVFLMIMLTNPLGTNLIMIASVNKKDYQKYRAKESQIKEKQDEDGEVE